ncbi:MAG TPA: hypothetical protein VLW46_00315 [Candidatus Bathyarchaeia archaeon]|nr:hypothetical protein [Candidatus Bathyarchaeia archaeon]
MKYIGRLLWVVTLLFSVASSTHAQQCPGYNPTMTQESPGGTSAYIPPLPCSGQISGTEPFYQTNTTTDYCGSLETGGYVSNPSTVTGNGVASCGMVDVYCAPLFELEVTPAANQQDYNRFYNRAYDSSYSSSSKKCLGNVAFRQDYWQCGWYSCPPPPGPPPPPQCCPYSITLGCVPCTSPIVIDTDGRGFDLTSAQGGVEFDISGSGHTIQLGWTATGSKNAFLALPGPDGLVHNGRELFGNFTPQPPSNSPNGFAALAVYDDPKNGGNGNGVIDPGDMIYSQLRLWIDANHDGVCQPDELHTLASLGVTSISLHYSPDRKTDQYGNVFRYRAAVDPSQPDPDHVGRTAYDVFFVSLQPVAKAGLAQKCPVTSPNLLKPAPSLFSEKSSRLE